MSDTNIKVTISPERNIVVKLDFGGYNDHGALPGLSDDDHPQYVKHSLATAVNDFLVASGVGVFIKKTVAEVKTILGLGSAAYTESSTYAPAAEGVTNGDSHDHNGGDGAQIAYSSLSGTPPIPSALSDLSDDSTHRTVTDTEKSTWNGKTDLATVKADTDIADALSKKHASGSDAETTTTIGALINGADSKTTPVDADMVGLMDSAASNILKKLSWANIKATLKTYFDSLYPLRANNLSDVANAATAFGNIKQSATTSATGVVELATQAEVLAGTDTSRAVVPADLWALVAQSKNPLALAQAINMTYASSGSSGITVADDDDIDFGTGNFTLVWKGALPDWTPSVPDDLVFKRSGSAEAYYGYRLLVNSNGTLSVYLYRNSTETIFTSTAATGLTDGTEHEIAAVVTRETASTAGSVVFYVDKVALGSPVAITATATVSITNTGTLYISGNIAGMRFASINKSALLFNRALTADEVADLYDNGIADADKWGSQANLNLATIINNGYTTFSGASDTAFHAESDGSGTDIASTTDAIPYVSGKKYRITFDLSLTSGTLPKYAPCRTTGGTQITGSAIQTAVEGRNTYEFTAGETTTGTVVWYNESTTTNYDVSNFSILKIGATLALEPEGIQPAPGQWLDSSTNKLHAMQPAEGSSLTRRKKDFEYRWTNTWTGTHEAQYIGGVNQNVLPSGNIRIDSITMVCTATGVNVILGDGSDTDRFVASVALATYLDCTIANRNHDGTNRKLVIDPDGNLTGSITTTIRGTILD